MASISLMEHLIRVLGGEENLPPKLPQHNDNAQQTTKEAYPTENPSTTLPPATQTDDHRENWWDATPQIPKAVRHDQPKATVTPFTSQGETHFEFDSRKDQAAPLGVSFSPFGAITKFPYKFVKKEFMQPIATAFFDQGKIYNRDWDIYYIWSDYYETAKPVTFVPEHQLLALIDQINESFPNAKVKITDELREEGLIINFDDIDRVDLRPHYLGHSTSREQLEYWTANLPFPAQLDGAMPSQDQTLEAFRAKMELANEAGKNKRKAASKKRQAENVVKRQSMVRMQSRAQRYLGLLPKSDDSELPDVSKLSLAPIDVTQAAPYAFDSDVIFIAIDVEAYERPPHPITEVGVATLDTRDLLGCAPGTQGVDWQKLIRARHFRVTEYKDFVNSEFVDGCPKNFEFGDSEMIGSDKICKTVADCFKQPYSGSPSNSHQSVKRNIVLVGHDVSQDINYLQKLGYSVTNCSNIKDTVDTAALFRAYSRDPNARSLGNVLYEFDLQGWYLHNAGNDAVYTLWAMLALATRDASDRGSSDAAQRHAEALQRRTELAVEQAKERVKDEAEGWDSTGDDGGVPIPPAESSGNVNKKGRAEPNRQLYTIGGNILDV